MKNKYEKKEIELKVKDCLSIAQLCRELGIRPNGGNYKTIQKYVNQYKIDISHFTGKAWNVGERHRKFGREAKLDDILVENSTYVNSNSLKKKLYKAGLKEEKCEECNITDWNDKKITFELDHINGRNLDHRIENLKILCPNCHSQTKTFRGRGISKKENISERSEFRKNNYEKI